MNAAPEDDVKYTERFRVRPGHKVRLKDIDPAFKGHHDGHKQALEEIERDREKLRALQALLYANNQRSLLICLQGLDSAGKDGTIDHILGAMNPQGCRVVGFKQPSVDEHAHDFLWRIHKVTPPRGQVAIFNRSHYEDVLVPCVHQFVSPKIIRQRLDDINEFEDFLVDNDVVILKFFLHISRDEQARRLQSRLDDPDKHWKLDPADFHERQFWPQYVAAYEHILATTSHKHAPWFVIPSDQKWYRNLVISGVLADTLKGLKLRYPRPTVDPTTLKL